MSKKQEKTEYFEWEPRKWILPPGLTALLQRFTIRCKLILDNFMAGKSRPLLICGPTGVGKSLFSEIFVYEFQKQTQNKRVLFVNCAALPGTLLESELFGYERGAHSTAFDTKKGYFEEIGNGIIVLEEIGEMAKHIQAKLLMVIENRIFSRLGSTEHIQFKAQIVATTNVNKSKFRSDFLYRFNTFFVPPLHERRNDILYYINHINPELIKHLTKGAVLSLLSYNWPGNVREIEHICNAMLENITELEQMQNAVDMIEDPAIKDQVEIIHPGVLYTHNEVSDFKFDKILDFSTKLQQSYINIEPIENALQQNLLRLDLYGSEFYQGDGIFSSGIYDDENSRYFASEYNELFDLAYSGFCVFCKIFFQDVYSINDILDLTNFSKYEADDDDDFVKVFNSEPNKNIVIGPDIYKTKASESKSDALVRLSTICIAIYVGNINNNIFWPAVYRLALVESLKYISKINDIALADIADLHQLLKTNKGNSFLSNYFNTKEDEDLLEEVPIENIAYSDLKELYYETLCNKIGFKHGSQIRIAEIAKFSTATISKDFSDLKIREKFSNPNFPARKRLVIFK